MTRPRIISSVCLLVWLTTPVLAFAQTSSEVPAAAVVDQQTTDTSADQASDQSSTELQDQVKQSQDRIKELNSMIAKYKDRISQQDQMQETLQNTLAILDNQIQEKSLTLERTKQQIALANLDIQRTDQHIKQEEVQLGQRQIALAALLRQIRQAQQVSFFDALLSHQSVSEFFAHVDQLHHLEDELTITTKNVKQTKADLERKKTQLEAQRETLQKQQQQIQKDQQAIADQRGAKASLLVETSNQESTFRRILSELHEEQQSTTDDILNLQDKLQSQLEAADQALQRGDILLNWPIEVKRGISARFHDPDYPYRHLFEHPGVDLPTPVGTPVRAAAGGYIAYTRVGKQYGNYIMIIHPGGIATIYAHLSGFHVKPDQYVERGEIIGFSGGQPGDEGAGLSTGAHLHFEVRQNGIPTDPMQFLPDL